MEVGCMENKILNLSKIFIHVIAIFLFVFSSNAITNGLSAKQQFDNYKIAQKLVAEEYKNGNEGIDQLVENAKNEIDNLAYRSKRNLDTNKDRVDNIIRRLDFNVYKVTKKSEAEKYKDGSGKIDRIVEDAKDRIDNLDYDSNLTLDDNKSRVDSILQSLAVVSSTGEVEVVENQNGNQTPSYFQDLINRIVRNQIDNVISYGIKAVNENREEVNNMVNSVITRALKHQLEYLESRFSGKMLSLWKQINSKF